MLHKDGSRIHKEERYEKDYLIDKYGAIPILKSIDIFKGAGDLGNIGVALPKLLEKNLLLKLSKPRQEA